MASFKQYTASGGASEAFSINTFSSDEIKVYVDNVLKTAATHYNITSYTTSGGTVTWTTGNVPNGVVVRIVRDTGVLTSRATYAAGSSVKADDLNNNQTQVLRSLEEQDDQLIQTYDVEDSAITTAKIKADNITSALIADDQINSEHIAPGAVDLEHMSANSVDSDQYVDGSIDLVHMSANSVDSNQYVDGSIDTVHIADSQVTTAKLANDAVTNAKIADNSIDSEHYVDGSIDTAHLADNSVTGAKLAAGTIGTTDIADSGITTAKIADANITTAKIAGDAINGTKIADDSIDSEHYVDGSIDTAHIADGQVTHVKLANDAVDGDNISDNSINSEHYVDGSIDTAHIANSQVTTAKLASDAVTTVKITDLNVTTAKIAADAITGAKIADDAVDSEHLAADSIDSEHYAAGSVDTTALGADAVTGAKIADDAINSEHYTDGSIDTAHIADAQVTTAKIAADAITGAKVADDAIDSEHYVDGSIDTAHIANSAVTAAKLGTINLADLTNVHTATPSDGHVLKWINSNSRWEPAADAGAGGATLADGDYGDITVSSSGAVLTIDDDVITGAKLADNLDIPDSNKIRFGAGNDLQIYHNGSQSFIDDAGSGALRIRSNQILLEKYTGENLAKFTADGAVELYYDNSKNFETNTDGCLLGDSVKLQVGGGADLQIYHTSDQNYIDGRLGNIYIRSEDSVIIEKQDADGTNQENMARFLQDNAVELYYDNTKRFETTSIGASVTGDLAIPTTNRLYFGNSDVSFVRGAHGGSGYLEFGVNSVQMTVNGDGTIVIPDNNKFVAGTGNDLQIYHDGSNSWIKEAGTGILFIDTNGGHIRLSSDGNTDTMANFFKDGAVELYYDNSKKFETSAAGVIITGVTGTDPSATIYHSAADVVGEVIRIGRTDSSTIRYHSIKAQHSGAAASNILQFHLHDSSDTTSQTEILELTGDGRVHVNDNIKFECGTGNDLQIYHNGSHTYLDNDTGNLYIRNNVAADVGGDIHIRAKAGENSISCLDDGGVELYYDDSKKVETYSSGIKLNGTSNVWIQDSGKLVCGAGSDLQIYHNPNSSYIDNNTGHIFIRNNVDDDDGGNIYLQAKSGENGIIVQDDGPVNLYYDNALKLSTTSTGVYVTGGIRLGADNAANEMDDYEEGTFTITARDATSGGNATTTNSDCFYTKVGRLVTVQVKLSSINTTGMTSSNLFYMTGLPFTSADTTGNRSTASCYVVHINPASSGSVKEHLNAIVAQNTSYVYFAWSRTEGEGSSTLKVNDIDDDEGDFDFTLTYTAT